MSCGKCALSWQCQQKRFPINPGWAKRKFIFDEQIFRDGPSSLVCQMVRALKPDKIMQLQRISGIVEISNYHRKGVRNTNCVVLTKDFGDLCVAKACISDWLVGKTIVTFVPTFRCCLAAVLNVHWVTLCARRDAFGRDYEAEIEVSHVYSFQYD